jgi:hypothetical protein
MNALADAQAVKFGADPGRLQEPIRAEDMNVYTNSPISNYRCEASEKDPATWAMAAWLIGMLGALMIVACMILVAWILHNTMPPPTPPVEPPPATADGDLHIRVVPVDENPSKPTAVEAPPIPTDDGGGGDLHLRVVPADTGAQQ